MLPKRNLRFFWRLVDPEGPAEGVIAMQVSVQDVMTRSPIAVPAETTIEKVLDTLVTEGVPSVYVTTAENRLAGIVTDYEVLKHQVLGGDRNETAETLMSRNVPTVHPEDSAMAVCPQFRDGRLARMAVIDGEGRLVGNLARRDVMRMMLTIERMACETPIAAADSSRPVAPRAVPAPLSVQVTRKPAAATV
jgi:CBS domain-containing protein